MSSFNRRDLLKLLGFLPTGLYSSKILNELNLNSGKTKNIIIVVFDAFSAHNISLYGYNRDTTPNINRLAERAIVYHNHIAGSNFTTSGTASLLTGTLPWTHRALQANGKVLEEYKNKSVFSAFDDYYRIAYSHNEWVNTLFKQFSETIDEWIPREDLYLFSSDAVVQGIFPNDRDISSVAWARNIKIKDEGYAYSLYLSRLFSYFEENQIARYVSKFPWGLPTAHADNGFLLEHAIDETIARINVAPKPFLGYFHFLPPHDPYRPPEEFSDVFRGNNVVEKPLDIFALENSDHTNASRKRYDEFILYVDREFGRLYEALEKSGALEDTWLVLTSDHGEAFERGIVGHSTDALYHPLIRVPLLIFEPGRTSRKDIYSTTSVIDLLPTLLHLNDKDIPKWLYGNILPPYGEANTDRSVYSLRSYYAESDAPLNSASIVLVKGRYKLHYYYGYSVLTSYDLVKLFDIEADPEELLDISESNQEIVKELLTELKTKLTEVDEPYI
jgi:arylsulfatase A-like enzyme